MSLTPFWTPREAWVRPVPREPPGRATGGNPLATPCGAARGGAGRSKGGPGVWEASKENERTCWAFTGYHDSLKLLAWASFGVANLHSIAFCFDGILRLEIPPRKNAQHSVLFYSSE